MQKILLLLLLLLKLINNNILIICVSVLGTINNLTFAPDIVVLNKSLLLW